MARSRPGPEGGRRDLNRRERTRQLLDAASTLFLERGIDAVSIDEITSRAGVAKGSFYRYFASRDQLVETLFAPLIDTLRQATTACRAAINDARSATELTAAYGVLVRDIVPLFSDHRGAVELYLRENRRPAASCAGSVAALRDEIVALAIDLTLAAQAHNLLREVHPRLSALTVIGAAERLIIDHFDGNGATDPLLAASELIAIVLDGLRPT